MARDKGWYWPYLLVLFMLGGIVPGIVLVAVAIDDPSFAVEENYYEKALAWDQQQKERRESRALGWAFEVAVQNDAMMPGFRRVGVVVRDREGAPIENCDVALETFHNARAADRLRVALDPLPGAAHAASVPMRRAGLWELRFAAQCGEKRFVDTLTRELSSHLP